VVLKFVDVSDAGQLLKKCSCNVVMSWRLVWFEAFDCLNQLFECKQFWMWGLYLYG
jgi:hypothetical protein